jgi:hypothetical protein
LIADMSVAPELAQLARPVRPAQSAQSAQSAESALPVPAQHAAPQHAAAEEFYPEGYDPDGRPVPMTAGRLARRVRVLAATPERWWRLVRFEPGRSVEIEVEQGAGYRAWLVVLPPDDAGRACDCEVATMIAGEATEGAAASPVLRPGPLRVHAAPHVLRGQGAGYSISLHIERA